MYWEWTKHKNAERQTAPCRKVRNLLTGMEQYCHFQQYGRQEQGITESQNPQGWISTYQIMFNTGEKEAEQGVDANTLSLKGIT